MKKPTLLTDEQIEKISLDTWLSNGQPFATNIAAYTAISRAIEAARDAQWVEMLAGQEPVAWRDPSNIDPSQSVTFDKMKALKWPHIYRQPLYTHPQPDHVPDAGKMVQEPVYYEVISELNRWTWIRVNKAQFDECAASNWKTRILYTHPQPDDTALLRQALEALRELQYANTDKSFAMTDRAIAALEARLK